MPRLEFDSEVVRLADLTVTGDLVKDVVIRNCLIIGPAIVAPLTGTSIHNCDLGGSATELFWLVEAGRGRIFGAIGLENCTIEDSRFERVGFAGTEDMRRSFTPEGQLG